jgi:hypothetical protein
MSENLADIDVVTSISFLVPKSMPEPLKVALLAELKIEGLDTRELVASLDPLMITQIVKSITGKDQFKEKEASLRTFLNAMKIQANDKEAKLSSQSFNDLVRTRLGYVIDQSLEVEPVVIEAMSKDLCVQVKSTMPQKGDSFVNVIDKCLRWITTLVTLIRLNGVEVPGLVVAEYMSHIIRVARVSSESVAIKYVIDTRSRMRSEIQFLMESLSVGKCVAVLRWLRVFNSEVANQLYSTVHHAGSQLFNTQSDRVSPSNVPHPAESGQWDVRKRKMCRFNVPFHQ